MNNLDEILLDIEHGDLQLEFNVALEIHVLVHGDGFDYSAYIIGSDGKVIKSFNVGFGDSNGYYSAKTIAAQCQELPEEYKI